MSQIADDLAPCAAHGRPRDETCGRCGDYECPVCMADIEGERYCRRCVRGGHARDYLDEYRESLWGKRDGWGWLMGVGAIFNVWAILVTLGVTSLGLATISPPAPVLPRVISVGLLLFGTLVCVTFFMGIQWARPLLLLSLILGVANSLATLAIGGVGALVGTAAPPGFGMTFVLAMIVVAFFGQLLLVLMILSSTRNKLFFKIEVPRAKLRKLYLRNSNQLASLSLRLGLLGVFGFTIPFSLILAIWGLTKVDLNATPPVGGRGYAVWGILLSVMWMAMYGLLFATF